MKTCFRNPIGLLAGFTLSLMPLAANAQEDRPMPPPPGPERPMVRPEQAPGERMRAEVRRERERLMERQAAKENADRREERRLIEDSMEAYRRGDPAGAVRMRESIRKPVEKRVREAAKKEILRKNPAQPAPPRVRIQHLRQAAEHLQAAGFPDYADKARKEAERIAEEARKQPKNDANPELTEKVNKLSRQVEELREQIRRMKADETPKPPQP